MTKQDPLPAAVPRSQRWWRRLWSLLLLLHLTAVFIAPFTFASATAPGVASPAATMVMGALRPYIDAAFLNHGYFFFAPNPGASHLVRYRLEFADSPARQGRFPDIQRHFPRLLYHRHFMLSEQLHSMYVPPQPPAEITDPFQIESWPRRRQLYLMKRDCFADHLRHRYGAARVTLTRVQHRPPHVYEVLAGKGLDSPDLYRDLSEDDPEVGAAW